MNAQATLLSRHVLKEPRRISNSPVEKREKRLLDWTVHLADKLNMTQSVRIQNYTPYLQSNWLSTVESRIRESVKPDEYEIENSAEWLTVESAFAAIAFFRSAGEALPSEPHIYATSNGDLVAEFETPMGSMTSIVSSDSTVLFAILANNPHEPIQKVISRGSNTLKEELRSVTKKLSAG